MSQMSVKEANNCSKRSDAMLAALQSYYNQTGASMYNSDEALKVLLTLAIQSKRASFADCQKKFSNLSKTLQLKLYVDLEDVIPQSIKQQRYLFRQPSMKWTQSRIPRMGKLEGILLWGNHDPIKAEKYQNTLSERGSGPSDPRCQYTKN